MTQVVLFCIDTSIDLSAAAAQNGPARPKVLLGMAALDDDRSHAVSETTAPPNMIAASSDQQLRDALDQFKGHKVR